MPPPNRCRAAVSVAVRHDQRGASNEEQMLIAADEEAVGGSQTSLPFAPPIEKVHGLASGMLEL